MRNEILVVPDVHGRKFWEKPCREWDGPIVFLGDYHDPYSWQVNNHDSFENLKTLVRFYEDNKSRVICLLGNHDGNYLICRGFADRQDYHRYYKVQELLRRLNLRVAYETQGVLFSHAGVLKEWLDNNKLTIKDLPDMAFTNNALRDVSPLRGGDSEVGGILWGDVIEYTSREHVPSLYQVFGHSQMEDEVIQKDFACLDCRKCFIINLDSKEIKRYLENA